jgi:apolipoprotein N-acyltransferase
LKKLSPFYASFLSGILLWASWPTSALTFLIFIGFVPLLLQAEKASSKKVFFLQAWAAMFIWNALTTWWIWNSSAVGAVSAIIPNSLLMTLPWLGYVIARKKISKPLSLLAFISFWMLFEYTHLNWQLSWPWLSLGNVFAQETSWVQWYEFTGIGGGTLWVLIINLLVFNLIVQFKNSGLGFKIISTGFIGLFLIVPIVFSSLLSIHFFKGVPKQNVVIVQPNIDPYQKFESNNANEQIKTLIQLSEQKIDSNTCLVLWPETALSTNVSVGQIQVAEVYRPVMDFVQRHPKLTLITGVETNKFVEEKTSTSRKTREGLLYESYNAAIALNSNQPMQFYIKSKLVPGVETLPTYLNFLGSVFEQFGGTAGGYAKDTAAKAFPLVNSTVSAAPVICYESVYGEYVASYVAKGANLITILTNDGWWGNTQGHLQHLAYAKLRAIETRKWVARSANTGISAVIDNYGNIKQQTKWNEATSFAYDIPVTNSQTFYVKHGDYLYQIFFWLGWLMMGWLILIWIKDKTKK